MVGNSDSRAILWGLALGDALGWPTEFKRLPAIKRHWGPQGIQEPPHPALITDDTQMTLAIAYALVQHPASPLEMLMHDVVAHFIEWKNSPDNDRAPGNTCIAAVAEMERGVPWRQAGIEHAKGCGSAMRVAPIGYLYQFDPDSLYEVAHATGIATHRHPTADAATVAAAYLVKLGLDGYAPLDMIDPTLEFVADISPEFDTKLNQVREVVTWPDEEAALAALGDGWVAEEAVALALYCCARYPNDWVGTVRRGANSSGDSDSVACIAGGIQAARLGLSALPPRWLDRLERRDEMRQLADDLARARAMLLS